MDLGQCCNLYSAALRIVWACAIFKGQSRTSDSSVVPKLTVGGVVPLHAPPPLIFHLLRTFVALLIQMYWTTTFSVFD